MHVISILGSKTQKSKLRNGHKVRIKHGAGFNVIVSPNTYHIVSRAFLKNKGISLQLSPEEMAMNKAPTPEMQQQIMGHNQHMIIPGVLDHLHKEGRGLGTVIGDFFKDIGNKINGGFEDKIINPIKENIVNPATDLVNKYVPSDVQQDIKTGLKFSSPTGLAFDALNRLRKGEKIQDIGKNYYDDLRHLNDTKNKVIKSSPALTEAYKKGVPALAGLATGAVGSAFGLSPVTGALLGAAGAKGADELLKAEGYGLHHMIDLGMHKYKKNLKHRHPIGGSIGRGHISDFFKNAGKKVKDFAVNNFIKPATPYVKSGADMLSKLHEMVLNNPALGAKIKEHGSKLAGILAKEGVKYMTGNDELGELAGKVGEEGANAGMKRVGYGEERPKSAPPRQSYSAPAYSSVPAQNSPLKHDSSAYHMARQEMANKGMTPLGGHGLYAGRQRGVGLYGGSPPVAGGNIHHFGVVNPPSRLVGGGFNSYDTLHQATIDNAKANHRLARMHDNTVYGQHDTDPIKKYWDEEGAPPSRGTGLHKNHHGKVHHSRKAGFEKSNHYNLVRGRGSLLEHKSTLPPALQSQPYGSNFHMQNMLPPQYQKYNDGTNEY
jgi:hypothetical protein